jgi:hypothetical protein
MKPGNIEYLIISFILCYIFFNIYFSDGINMEIMYNGNIFLWASLVSLIMFFYQESFKLCGLILLVIILFLLKKKT